MCLIIFAYNTHPEYPLIVAANRDEFYQRPTAEAKFWECGQILAGKDLERGGTWLGVTRSGKIAFLTNYREAKPREGLLSRGQLIVDFLQRDISPQQYLQTLEQSAKSYGGYNLIFGNVDELWHFSNVNKQRTLITSGVHGVCNHLLNTPWPKVEKSKQRFQQVMTKEITKHALFDVLQDREQAEDQMLPATGVPYPWEKALSSVFIQYPGYGTRSSTVITVDNTKKMMFCERGFDDTGEVQSDVCFEVCL